MSVEINENYITFFTTQIEKINEFKKSGKTSALSEVCWYADDQNTPFTDDLIDVNICKLDNFKFIDSLKKIISDCFKIYKKKFKDQKFFLWESVEPDFIYQYNLFRSLLLEYLLVYTFAYVLLRKYYSDKDSSKKKNLENIKNAKLSKNGRIIYDFKSFSFPVNIIIPKVESKKKRTSSSMGSSTAPRRSSTASRRSSTASSRNSTASMGISTSSRRGSTSSRRSSTASRRSSTASRRSSTASSRNSTASRRSSTASRRSSTSSRTASNISSLRRNSTASQIILPNHIENLIAAGSTSPSSDYDVTLDFEYIEGLKINLIINYAFQKFMVEENTEYNFENNKSLGKLFDSNIYSHKTSVSSNHYEKLKHYFLPLEEKSFLLPKLFIQKKSHSIFIREELRNCLSNDIDEGKTEETILKDLLIHEVDLNSTYNKIAKYKFKQSTKTQQNDEPIKLYKSLVSFLHKCLKHAVEVYEGISTIYHVVYALQLKDKEAINYFETDNYSYRVAFVSAVDNLVHLIHLMNDEDYVVKGRPIINSKNVKYVARILHAYNLCEIGIERNTMKILSKGGSSSITQKREGIKRIRKLNNNNERTITRKKLNNNNERTITRKKLNNNNEGTITPGETEAFYDLGSYNFLMKIKNDETIKLKDFNYPEFNAIKIFILSKEEYNSDGTDISYLVGDDFEIFYNLIGYSISSGEQKSMNTRGTENLLNFKKEFYSKKIFLEFIKYKIIKLLEKLPPNNNIVGMKDLINNKLIVN